MTTIHDASSTGIDGVDGLQSFELSLAVPKHFNVTNVRVVPLSSLDQFVMLESSTYNHALKD